MLLFNVDQTITEQSVFHVTRNIRTGTIDGSPLVRADFGKAISSTPSSTPIAVISTLAQTRRSGNPRSTPTSPPGLMTDSLANLLSVASQIPSTRIQKLVVMSMHDTSTSYPSLNFLTRSIMRYSNMSLILSDHNSLDAPIRSSRIDFVLVRSVMLKGESAAPVKDLGDNGERASFMPSISRASFAGFLLHAVEVGRWDGRAPVVSN